MIAWHSILLYTSFVLVLKCDTTTAFNVTRGRTDKFTNPRCVSGACTKSSTSINCNGLNGANCVTPRCFECQCNSNNPTFYQNNYSDGTCVKNEKLLLSLSKCILIIYVLNTPYDDHLQNEFRSIFERSSGASYPKVQIKILALIPYNAIDYLFL